MVATENTTARTTAAVTRTTGASPASGRRARNRALWTIQILLAAFLLIVSAAPKFAGQREAVEDFAKIGWGQWFRYFTGAVEAAGGIGLLIPRLAGWAALGLIGLMVGAIITQVFVLVPALAVFPAVLGVVFAVIARVRMPQAVSPAALFRR
ncbi:DoxX family protein [Actinoallomurus spadix]|uniref:DoxX family protein n=1 Tax=Actinoallomurus spadix TaxID=79912 RepID=A0ABN0XD94_9ACTN|nr:DoxX family protein [Actinoallomurus spadix]MCO5988761.1 DoxX family protein [Actinoallomurus spadix]